MATTKRGPPRAEMDSRFSGNDREGTGQGSGAFTHHSRALLHPDHPLGPRVSPSPPASPIEGALPQKSFANQETSDDAE